MKGMPPTIAWSAWLLALFISFLVDFENTAQGGALDLRNRITGERLLLHHIDPYYYKWHPSDPEEYCDLYNNPSLPVSKTTATPALLLVHLPLGFLPYRIAQFLWFFIQWALLLATARLWLRTGATLRQKWLVALAVAGFTYTAAWRLHAERGQAYVLLLFLFAHWLAATRDPRRGNRFSTGLLAGFLAALRPPFVLLLPFLALHRRGQFAGATVGLLIGIVLPMLWDPGCWPHYFSAMQVQSAIYRSDYAPHGFLAWPSQVEGIPTNRILAVFVPIPFADFSAHALLRALGAAPFPTLPVLLAAVVPFGLWLGLSRRLPAERLLPALAAWLFLLDLFLPAYRNSYNDVLILNVIALGLLSASRLSVALCTCFLGLPLGWIVYALSPEQAWLINLPTFFLTLGAILFLFLPLLRQAAARNVPAGARRGGNDLC